MKNERHMPVSAVKARLLEILRLVEEQHSQIVITKNGVPKAVLVPYQDLEGLIETIDILSDSKTVAGIKKGLKDIKRGKVISLKEAFKD